MYQEYQFIFLVKNIFFSIACVQSYTKYMISPVLDHKHLQLNQIT